jgi:hypothetical protein
MGGRDRRQGQYLEVRRLDSTDHIARIKAAKALSDTWQDSARPTHPMLWAIMFTRFPWAFFAMRSHSLSALASMDPEGGTAATITSIPFSASASVIPLQYCKPRNAGPASRSSSKPNRPCASTILCF